MFEGNEISESSNEMKFMRLEIFYAKNANFFDQAQMRKDLCNSNEWILSFSMGSFNPMNQFQTFKNELSDFKRREKEGYI